MIWVSTLPPLPIASSKAFTLSATAVNSVASAYLSTLVVVTVPSSPSTSTSVFNAASIASAMVLTTVSSTPANLFSKAYTDTEINAKVIALTEAEIDQAIANAKAEMNPAE